MKRIKMILDVVMTLLILMLMAYQITGQFLHEIAGTVMIILFMIHIILNRKWYKSLTKGKYNPNRIYMTAINALLCISAILLAYSGITMSGYVFRFLPNKTGAATARLIHLAASHWGFVLISLHLGNHWSMILKMLRRTNTNKYLNNALRIFGFIFAFYGAICFIQSDFWSYMFLINQFVLVTTDQSVVLFFLQYFAMMGFFVFLGYYISKGLQKMSVGKIKKKEKKKRSITVKKRKKKWIIIGVILVVVIVLICTVGIPYYRRHFVTNEVSVKDKIEGNHAVIEREDKILTVYFTRLGNTDFDKDVDAVSSASLMKDGDELYGNSQLLAEMVQSVVGGDIYTIETKEKYPSSYSDTVSVAKDELNEDARPELASEDIDISDYDTIVLIYPLWWSRVPMPVATFLEKYDFSGKTILPLVTHGGSGVGDSMDDLKSMCKAEIGEPLEVYDDEVSEARDEIISWLGGNN